MAYVRIEDATHKKLAEEIISAIGSAQLSMNKLINVGMDGPNVNTATLKEVHKQLAALGRGDTINVGSCLIHVLHNTFQEGLKICGDEVEKLLQQLHSWFSSRAR